MQAVHILARVQGVNNGGIVNMRRQGQLYQDAVKAGIGVQLPGQGEQFLRGGGGGQSKGLAEHSGGGAGPFLVADIDRRGRVIADQHGGQAGRNAVPFLHFGHAGGHFRPHHLRQSPPIQQLRH